jgi:hypothetical protein
LTAFAASIVVLALMVGVVIAVGRRRPPGTPLTWGEALVAGVFVFGLLLVVYGVVPNSWLQFADKDLKWRSDKIGVPLGPLHSWFGVGNKQGLLWGKGIPLANGHFIITAQTMRDLIVTVIYTVFGLAHIFAWRWWQRRGKVTAAPAELESSAYGRPLVRST